MSAMVISKIVFTVTFPPSKGKGAHIPYLRLRSLATHELSDQEIIETIDHLFRCSRCFENYRSVRQACLDPCS